MGRTLSQKIARLPAKRRAGVKARAAELIAEELKIKALRDLTANSSARKTS
jgi:hypothetical protein